MSQYASPTRQIRHECRDDDCQWTAEGREGAVVEQAWGHRQVTGHGTVEIPLSEDGRTSGVRVVCMDCEVNRIWLPGPNQDIHEHDSETSHDVRYEGQYDRAVSNGGGRRE